MRNRLLIASAAIIGVGIIALGNASTPPVVTKRTAATGTCAADATWVAALGITPRTSRVSRFDAMRSRGGFGAGDTESTFNEFDAVRRSSEEKYSWRVATQSVWDRDLQMIVLRDADGPIPKSYGAGTKLASGVIEYPEVSRSFLKATFTLFVFPDHTWARMEGDATRRFRDLHAKSNTPPPLPAIDGDVAWEECGAIDPNDLALPYDVWSIDGGRVIARLFASRSDGELVYPFASAPAARWAASDQAARCASGRCPWVTGSTVDGALVRYRTTVTAAPTSTYAVLKIATPAAPLAAPPKTFAAGAPASGVYQLFVTVASDTCPTHATGGAFPSMMELVLVTHPAGKPVAALAASSPVAKGILSGDPLDVTLEVGASAEKFAKHLCPHYAIHWTSRVLAVGADGIRVRTTVEHVGSTAGCVHTNLPSNCTQETETTWALARPACAAACDASYKGPYQYGEGQPAPKVDVTCVCP